MYNMPLNFYAVHVLIKLRYGLFIVLYITNSDLFYLTMRYSILQTKGAFHFSIFNVYFRLLLVLIISI